MDNKNSDSIASRIQLAMSIRNMKQIDLAEKTKIQKASISHYVIGRVEPKSDRIYLIAKALDVNPVWLMGMDVPMEVVKAEPTKENAIALAELMKDARLMEYIKKINTLSAEKKETLYSYIDFLISSNH